MDNLQPDRSDSPVATQALVRRISISQWIAFFVIWPVAAVVVLAQVHALFGMPAWWVIGLIAAISGFIVWIGITHSSYWHMRE